MKAYILIACGDENENLNLEPEVSKTVLRFKLNKVSCAYLTPDKQYINTVIDGKEFPLEYSSSLWGTIKTFLDKEEIPEEDASTDI